MIGIAVSVSPKTSTKASIPKRLRKSSTYGAVGAAKIERSRLSASSGRSGWLHTKSIITPTKLVTVAPESRIQRVQLEALNLR